MQLLDFNLRMFGNGYIGYVRPSFTAILLYPKPYPGSRSYLTWPSVECFLMHRHIKGCKNITPPPPK